MIMLIAVLIIAIVVYNVVQSQNGPSQQETERRSTENPLPTYDSAEWTAYRAKRQGEYRGQALNLAEEALSLFEEIPKRLTSAESYLDQAEVDFAEGTFAPFWQSIENSAENLGKFEELMQAIKGKLSEYTVMSIAYQNAYQGEVPAFPLDHRCIEGLSVGTATSERMKRIVRRAQSNFQFAVIYEQRKTNRVLIAGFTNLGQALDQMTWQITKSINDLDSSVQTMTSKLGESMQAIRSDMRDNAGNASRHGELILKNASEATAREEQVLIMLDNIQRGRRP